MVFKIVAIGLVGVVVSVVVKQYKPEFSILINIAVGVVLFCLVIEKLSELFAGVLTMSAYSNLSSEIVSTMFKVMGIGYLIEFSADVAEESGNPSIANKIVFAGKILVCCIALPILIDLFEVIISLL